MITKILPYDAAQRRQSITEQGTGINYVSNLAYNGAGQLTGLNLGDGTSESYTYDPVRQQLTDQQVTKGVSTLLSLHYNYAASAGQHGTGTTAGNSGQLIAMTDNLNSYADRLDPLENGSLEKRIEDAG